MDAWKFSEDDHTVPYRAQKHGLSLSTGLNFLTEIRLLLYVPVPPFPAMCPMYRKPSADLIH